MCDKNGTSGSPATAPSGSDSAPPESFVQHVRDALEHLYDFGYLERHPLATSEAGGSGSAQTPGQRLRQEVMEAVESLNPGHGVPFQSPRSRLYNALVLHRVEGRTVQEAAHELNVSARQVHRDLRRAEESIAAVLWARRCVTEDNGRAQYLSSTESEMARLTVRPQAADMRSLLDHALAATAMLARQRGVEVQVNMPDTPVLVSADPVIARQVIVNVLSTTLGLARPGSLTAALALRGNETQLSIGYAASSPDPARRPLLNPIVMQLVERLGWTLRHDTASAGRHSLTLTVASRRATILVIDDNPGFVDLLAAYLTRHACRVLAATNGQDGLRLAQQMPLDAIIIDVMMPDMDGWELLQRLRLCPDAAHVPVIVCSVINDPDLARSLGATLVLPKPVSQGQVLSALQRLGVF